MKFFKKIGMAFLASLFLFCGTVTPAYAAPGTKVYSVWSYKNISTATTTTIKSGSGIFHGFCVNTVGTTVVIFDNTAGSGNKIASWTDTQLGCFIMDAQFSTGLTAVTVGTGDLTFLYQ